MQSFVSELRRRNVLRVAAFYAAAGWLLVQVATQVFPFFDIPNWVVRVVVIAIVLGFLPALALSWFYELTPQGIVKTDDVTPAASITRHTGQRLNQAIIAALSLAVLVLLARLIWPHAVSVGGTAATAADDKSIAVLPFENLSDDKANAYFAEGIQDQVLTQLAKIGALRVISRTSTEQYASKPPSVADIAGQLGVANVLEGSVQKAGNAVRINVQLIRAAGDQHLWAETYDRTLDNVFGVESEVAQAIAQALDAHLSGAERRQLASRPTQDPAAWDLYLRASVLYVRYESVADSREAERSLREAVQRDPGFAAAWALLAQIKASESIENWDTSAAGHAEALAALQQAIRLRPDAAETRAAQGYYHFWVERDYQVAGRDFEQALQQAPGSADILSALAFLSRRQGHWQQSLEYFDRAVSVDPRNVEYLGQAGVTAAGMGNFPLAERYADRCLDVAPRDPSLLALRAWIDQAQGRLDLAEQRLAGLNPDPSDPPAVMALAFQKMLQRRYADGVDLLRSELGRLDPAQQRERTFLEFQLGEFQRLAGDADAAHATYLRARDDGMAVLADQPGNGDLLNREALIHARLGDVRAAMDYSRRALQAVPAGGDVLSTAAAQYTLARVRAAAGDRGGAIEILQGLLAGPSLSDSEFDPLLTPATLRLNPEWDGLRDDPRFLALTVDGKPPALNTP